MTGWGVIRGPAEEAEAVVVTDLDTDDDTPDMYTDRIKVWLARKLPLICANRIASSSMPAASSIAAVRWPTFMKPMAAASRMAGKPYRPIYDEALRLAEVAAGKPLDRGRILAIGDSVRTDAIGAANAGLDLLFVTGSIHAHEVDAFGSPDPEAIRALVAPSGARLEGFLPRLAW